MKKYILIVVVVIAITIVLFGLKTLKLQTVANLEPTTKPTNTPAPIISGTPGEMFNLSITPKASINGWLRVNYYDKYGTSFTQIPPFPNKSITLTQATYEASVSKTDKIYLTDYREAGIALTFPNTPGTRTRELLDKAQEKVGVPFRLINLKKENLITLSETSANAEEDAYSVAQPHLLVNQRLVLKAGDISSSFGSLNYLKDKNVWEFHYGPLFPTGRTQDVNILPYNKFIKLLEGNNITMFWSENGYKLSGNTFDRLDNKDDSITFDQVKPIYLAQSKGIIPSFLVCGIAYYSQGLGEWQGRDLGKTARVCGVTEAVDYGDY